MITFSTVKMMFLNYFFYAYVPFCQSSHCIMSHSAHLQPRVTNLLLCAGKLGNNSWGTVYRDVWQSRIQHGLLLSLSCILPAFSEPSRYKNTFLFGSCFEFSCRATKTFSTIRILYLMHFQRKGSVLFSQGFNALKQRNSNFFLFWATGAF